MDILFVNDVANDKLSSKVNGTMILATLLKKSNFDIDILHFYEFESYNNKNYFEFINEITSRIISLNPKCVSFNSYWTSFHIFIRIAQVLKEINPDIIIVMGGPHASSVAYETMKAFNFIDYVATGEGENTVLPFFTAILKENRQNIDKIPGLYYRNGDEIAFCDKPIPLTDINNIPHWDESLYSVNNENFSDERYFMPIEVGRGCPFNCTFCSTSMFWKRHYRLKSAEKIIEDIEYFNKKFGIKSFSFSHDAFTVDKELVNEICDAIIDKKLDIKWKCSSRADCLSEDLILKMKAAGMIHIEIGVESGSPTIQKSINKCLDLEKVKKTVKFLLDEKISVYLFFVYGFPDETEEDLRQTLNLYCDFLEMGVKFSFLTLCTFSPKTEITNKYFEQLMFNSNIKALSIGIYGYDEEIALIKNYKQLFPMYYNLNTNVRNNYQYLTYFALLYKKYTNLFRRLRNFYKNDILKFYSDFISNNIHIFNCDLKVIQENIKNNTKEMILNTIKNYKEINNKQIYALVDFEIDKRNFLSSGIDVELQKVYNFNYIEYVIDIPIQKYSDSSTELFFEKINGTLNIKIIKI